MDLRWIRLSGKQYPKSASSFLERYVGLGHRGRFDHQLLSGLVPRRRGYRYGQFHDAIEPAATRARERAGLLRDDGNCWGCSWIPLGRRELDGCFRQSVDVWRSRIRFPGNRSRIAQRPLGIYSERFRYDYGAKV